MQLQRASWSPAAAGAIAADNFTIEHTHYAPEAMQGTPPHEEHGWQSRRAQGVPKESLIVAERTTMKA
jgi:hypothetical protein